jgi:antagonist of KipI
MDTISHRLANVLVGNPDSAATLEMTVTGVELVFDAPAVFAVAGAVFELFLDDEPIAMNQPHSAGAKQTLNFGSRLAGARAYLAFAGGVDVPAVLGSRSTHVASGLGGLAGRALRAGDRLAVGVSPEPEPALIRRRSALTPLPSEGVRVRVLDGPDTDVFGESEMARFCSTRYRVTLESNRMGYRLEGHQLSRSNPVDPLSSGIPNGSVQVPASGDPIVLLADRQTVGGYPRIATVISADLPVIGQLMVSHWLEFERCSQETARRALVALEQSLIA